MLHVATQERNGLVNWDKEFIPMADTWLFTGLCNKQCFSGCRDFTVCKSNYAPSKKAFFCKCILKYLNLSEKSLLMDPCHSKDGQKSAPAWSSWHINVSFDDIVYLYFQNNKHIYGSKFCNKRQLKAQSSTLNNADPRCKLQVFWGWFRKAIYKCAEKWMS